MRLSLPLLCGAFFWSGPTIKASPAQLPVQQTLSSPCAAPGPITVLGDRVFVCCPPGSEIHAVSIATGEAVSSFDAGAPVLALQAHDDTLWVLTDGSSDFPRIRAFLPPAGVPTAYSSPVPGTEYIIDLSVDAEDQFWLTRRGPRGEGYLFEKLNRWNGSTRTGFSPATLTLGTGLGSTWVADRLVLLTTVGTFRYDAGGYLLEYTPGWDRWRMNPGRGLDDDEIFLWAGGTEWEGMTLRHYLVRFALDPVPVLPTSWGGIKRLYGID